MEMDRTQGPLTRVFKPTLSVVLPNVWSTDQRTGIAWELGGNTEPQAPL